jgi:hypothetical protein
MAVDRCGLPGEFEPYSRALTLRALEAHGARSKCAAGVRALSYWYRVRSSQKQRSFPQGSTT